MGQLETDGRFDIGKRRNHNCVFLSDTMKHRNASNLETITTTFQTGKALSVVAFERGERGALRKHKAPRINDNPLHSGGSAEAEQMRDRDPQLEQLTSNMF